jgi:predicted transcriptional regulator
MELTDRKLEILQLLANGYTQKEVAAELGITRGTVKNHILGQCRKDKENIPGILTSMGAKNTTHAVYLATLQGLLPIDGAPTVVRIQVEETTPAVTNSWVGSLADQLDYVPDDTGGFKRRG